MNIFYIIPVFFICFIGNCQITNGKVNYDFKIIFKENETVSDIVKEVSYSTIDLDLVLYFNQIESLYVNENLFFEGISDILSNSKKPLYYLKAQQTFLYNNPAFYLTIPEDYYLVNEFVKIDWKIDFDTSKTIDGFNCYKAEYYKKKLIEDGGFTLKKIVAWYTPDIPFPYGPAKFNGLPGLILEVLDYPFIYNAVKINLKSSIKINKLNQGISISENEYAAIKNKIKNDILQD